MNDSFNQIVNSAKEILILLPENPDFDVTAAGLGLYLSLKIAGKSAFISCPTPMRVEFNRLIGVNKIKGEMGGKNLLVKLVDYPAKNIEKVSYDIVEDEFRLLIVPKDGTTPPGADLVHLSYSGASADVVILIGGRRESDLPAISSGELAKAKLVHLGIGQLEAASNLGIMSFARPASSVSELATSFIKETDLTIDSDIATNLFSGIQKASGGLSNPQVSADTLELSAMLLRSGAQRDLPPQVPTTPAGRFPFMPSAFSTTPMPRMQDVEVEKVKEETATEVAPKDWLQPKIFTGNKGTSVS